MSVVVCARGQGLDVSSTSNELTNSRFSQDNYPVWTAYNGEQHNLTSYRRNNGVYKGLAFWYHYSPLLQNYSSYVGNQFLYDYTPYGLAPFSAGYIPRIINMYGSQSLQYGPISNNNADRGDTQFGSFSNSNNVRIISNTTLSSVDSSTAMTTTEAWTRHEWQQHLDIPDNVTSIKFGAQIKIDAADRLRPLNFAGLYCAEDRLESAQLNRYVNYFGIRHTDATFTLPTGTKTGDEAGYNWNGLTQFNPQLNANLNYFTPQRTHIVEKAMLDQNDYSDFIKVEYTFTPQSGTNRKMQLGMFFAENCSYLAAGGSENTGGFKVYDPFVEFIT